MPFEINIDPVAVRLGGLAVHWYGIIVVVAIGAAAVVALREAHAWGSLTRWPRMRWSGSR